MRRGCCGNEGWTVPDIPFFRRPEALATIDKPPTGKMTDLEYAIHLITSGRDDPEFAARVQAETAKITDDIRREHGVLNVAVDLVRETRDES